MFACVASFIIVGYVGGCSPIRWIRGRAALSAAKPRNFILFAEKGDAGRTIAQTPADATGPRCFKDRFTKASLLEEIAQDERRFTAAPGPGKLGTFELGTVSAAQLDFIKTVEAAAKASAGNKGYLLQVEGVDHAGCKSIVCMVNRVYGKPDDDITGMIVYDYYLKTGVVLNTGRQIMSYTDSQYKPYNAGIPTPELSLQGFLFNDAELKAFWTVARTYGDDGIFHRPSYNKIFRMPPNRAIVEPGYGAPTCGVAAAGWHIYTRSDRSRYIGFTNGWIQVTDKCLTLPRDQILGFSGDFYTHLTHEIAHHIDHSTIDPDDMKLSKSPEWKALSDGWTYEERVIDGKNYAYWTPGSTEQFATLYSQGSPVEDFADAVAYARYRGEEAMKKQPKKAKFLAEKLWGGRTFDEAGLIDYYSKTAAQSMLRSASESVSGCIREPSSAGAGEGFQMAMPDRLPAVSRECVARALNHEFEKQMDQLRSNEYEACDLLTRKFPLVKQKAAELLAADLSPILESNADLALMHKATEELRAELSVKLDAREVWLGCRKEAEPTECYAQTLTLAFEQVAQKFTARLSAESLTVEKNLYLETNSFLAVAKKVELFYRQLLGDSASVALEYGLERWDACLKDGIPTAAQSPSASSGEPVPAEDAMIPPTLPFTGGQLYVSAKILSCINLGFAADTQAIRERWARSRKLFQIGDEEAQAYILEFLSRDYLMTLQGLAEEQSKREATERATLRTKAVSEISTELLGNLAWLGNAVSVAQGKTACATEGPLRFDRWMTSRSLTGSSPMPLNFEALENIRIQWSDEACAKALQDPSIVRRVDANRARRDREAWQSALKNLERLVGKRADAFGLACARTNRTSAKRTTCMRSGWVTIETQALADWDLTDEGRRYASRRRDAESSIRLTNTRTRLQNEAIARMERG